MSMSESTAPSRARLAHFPISLFGVTMGVFGLALALEAGGFDAISVVIGRVGIAVLLGLLAALAAKAVFHPGALKEEWSHPVRLAFFPATSISLLLLASLLREGSPALADAVWMLGAGLHGLLTLVVISAWIGHRAFGPGHLSPAWFIPAVGNVVAPLAGVPLGHVELSWYFFAVGVLFWLILLTLVFNRLIFHDPLPGKLRPTLVIMVAPPAVAFLAWTQLQGGVVDDMGRIFLNTGYFFTLLVAVQAPALLRLPFALSFWALSFPLAAMSIASFRFAGLTGSPLHQGIGLVLLGVLVLVVAALTWRTLRAAAAGEICVPE